MAIKVADLIAAITLDTSKFDAPSARLTQLTNTQIEAFQRLAAQLRQTGFAVLTTELRTMLGEIKGSAALLEKVASAVKRVDSEAAKAAASVPKLITTIRASEGLGGDFRVGHTPTMGAKSP